MSNVFLITLNNASLPVVTAMVEASGPTSAKRVFLDNVAKVKKLSAGEAHHLTKAGMPMFAEVPEAAAPSESASE